MVIIDSVRVYRQFWFCIRVMVPTFFTGRSRPVLVAYVVLMQFLVSLMFPFHLLLGLLQQPTASETFQNLSLAIMCTACSLKHLAHIYHLTNIQEIEELLKQLDTFVESEEEQGYYLDSLQRNIKYIYRSINMGYGTIYILFLLKLFVLIFGEERELMYAAWIPFDWHRSSLRYAMALGYQAMCIIMAGFQGWCNDSYSPLILCHLGGHFHMLRIRLKRLGYRQVQGKSHYEQLLASIEQHKVLMRLHHLVRETISQVQLVQLTFCGATLCVVVCYVLFCVRDIIELMYNAIFFCVVCIQLFPSCYFASVVADEVQLLPNAIFSSKWYEESLEHRRIIRVFLQLTLGDKGRGRVMKAGGILELNLQAFFATLRAAYSLFAVVVRIRNE